MAYDVTVMRCADRWLQFERDLISSRASDKAMGLDVIAGLIAQGSRR